MGFETFDPDIFLDKNKCPFSKISVDFFTLFLKKSKSQVPPYDFIFSM